MSGALSLLRLFKSYKSRNNESKSQPSVPACFPATRYKLGNNESKSQQMQSFYSAP
jgi:hypothetical protein